MVRNRWTLALILICLSILATVITAFRVRDLPRFEDSVKIDRIQKCDDCDVKFGHKLHSIKTESDKYKSENFMKVVKKQQIEQKSGSKFDTSNENDGDLSILKGKSELKKDYPSTSKINLDTSNKKVPSFSNKDVDNSNTVQKSSPPQKTTLIKDTISKPVKYDVNRRIEHDDFKDDKKAVPLKPKLSEIKNADSKRTDANDKLTKYKDKSITDNDDLDHNKKYVGSKLKLVDTKKIDHKLKEESFEVSDSRSTSKEIEEDDDDDDDENDGDDDGDDDGALSSLWETFSMWGLNIDPSLKPAEKKEKQLIPKIKTTKQKNYTKETVTVPVEGLFKVKETTKKLEIKPTISNLRETVQKPLTKSVTSKMVPDLKKGENANKNVDNVDDDDENDNEGSKDMSQFKYFSKNKIKKTDERIKTKNKLSNLDVKTDDDDDDADFKLLEDKYKVKSSQNVKKLENTKKIVKTLEDSGDSDDVDDDKKSTNNIKKLLSTSKTTSSKDDKKNLITKKTFTIESKSESGDDEDDDYEDDDDEDDHDEDDDEDSNDSDQLLNKISRENKKTPEKVPLSESKKQDKKEINKQVAQGDRKVKKEEMVKSNDKKTVSSHSNKEPKIKEHDVKIAKLVAKNDTTSNELPKNEDTKERKESKSSDDKYKKETDKVDQAKDIKSKDKTSKAPQRSQPDMVGQKPVQSGYEKAKDSEDGLNMIDIKKEIKAQIRSNHEDKKSDKSKEKLKDSAEISSSIDSNLKHVTDALHRRNLLKSDFEDFYAFFPTFAPNFSRIHNPECRRHGQIVLRQLRGTKLWALNMLDATAKIPSGILQGNGIQLGDFDQCVGSRARVQLESGSVVKIQGKYCLARLDVKAEHPELETPVHLAQAKNLMRSRIDDPGHFVPRFSTLSWGVCVPSVCNPEDVEVIIKDAIKHYQKTSGVTIRVKVDEQDCHVEEVEWWKNWIELPVVLTLSFYGVVVLLVLVATLQDFFTRRNEGENEEVDEKAESNKKERKGEEKEDSKKSDNFIGSFSLYYTLDKLVAPGTTDDIACIHGVRAIATIALLIAHKFLPVAVMPYTNRVKITELASSPLWSWCRAGWMFTDCFLLLSGALTAYKASDNDSGAPRRLFSRYMRLTPALLALVLFYAYIWDNLSSGPMWGTFVTKNAEVCQEGWWWNLLYIQNYFGFEEMCAPQTHQLALDMQLTILGGILIWVMQIKQGVYKIVMPVLHIFAAYSRYATVKDHRLTMLAYHGVSVSQLYRTARLSYTSVLHRSTPYLVGLSLGLALKTPGEPGTFLLGIGWISSIALWCLVWWVGGDSGSMQYRYSSIFAAQYASLAPIASALAIAWLVYAVHNGGSSFLSRFLCCRPLVLISRLSYALYLTQFIVYITNVATVKTSKEFTLMSLIDVQEISAILLSAVILTVTFVIPMQSLHKIFIFPSKSKSSEQPTELTENKLEEEKKEKPKKEERNKIESPQLKIRPHLIAHREVLEEIPELEVEYESQRDNEGLGEILEEEEEDVGEESNGNVEIEDDLEIIEEEQGGEEEEGELWLDRRQYTPRRSDSNENENEEEIDEWEWTSNGSRNGAQYYRYSR